MVAHAYYAIGLNLHQPDRNLIDLLNREAWEARQLVRAYERPPRYVQRNRPEARLHVAFSGTLLMQLTDPGVRETFQHDVGLLYQAKKDLLAVVSFKIKCNVLFVAIN